MKRVNAILLPAFALLLGACSVSISDTGIHEAEVYSGRNDLVTVTLPSGKKDSFNCPSGTEVFVVDGSGDGLGMIYGCRTADAAVPSLDK